MCLLVVFLFNLYSLLPAKIGSASFLVNSIHLYSNIICFRDRDFADFFFFFGGGGGISCRTLNVHISITCYCMQS